MTIPFTYPSLPHARRHGPAGYADYESYRPWLRDEFAFRCVFCLTREMWGAVRGQYAIDHFVPVALRPAEPAQYDNLLYSCTGCNSAKGDRTVPDPLTVFLAEAVYVDRDGTMHGETSEASRLVELIDLNHPRMVEFRSLWISVVSLAGRFSPELLQRVLGYPADLPDLAPLKPPAGNTRPAGVADSHFARRQRGDLADTY
jgi:hypothetical protein